MRFFEGKCPHDGCGAELEIDTDGMGRTIETCPRHGEVARRRPGSRLAASPPAPVSSTVSAPAVAPALPYAVNGCCPHCAHPRSTCATCGQAPKVKGWRDCTRCLAEKREAKKAARRAKNRAAMAERRATRQASRPVVVVQSGPRLCACGGPIIRNGTRGRYPVRCSTCAPDRAEHAAYQRSWWATRREQRPALATAPLATAA
jgi:hypothetical protein